MLKNSLLKAVAFFAIFGAVSSVSASNNVTLYSVYGENALRPVLDPFTQATGIQVDVVEMKSDVILDRLEAEGQMSPADIHIDKDLVFFSEGSQKGLYQPIQSATIEQNIPANFIESNKNWFLMLYRSRAIIYNDQKVNASELSTYAQLADPKWRGRLCMRTSTKSYSMALGAYMIAQHGMDNAKKIFKGWVANFSQDPINSDTQIIRDVEAGKCDVAIVNHYYLAPFTKADPNYPVKVLFTNQGAANAHVNGIGMALTKSSKNVAAATMLLEYFSTAEVQAPVADAFNQYPTNPAAEVSKVLQSYGPFEADKTNVRVIGNLSSIALEAMQSVGYK